MWEDEDWTERERNMKSDEQQARNAEDEIRRKKNQANELNVSNRKSKRRFEWATKKEK